MPVYDPHVSLPHYFDFADTSKITKAGGGAIGDGDTVGEIASGGTSSAKWVQSGTTARPTWVASGPCGRPALRFEGTQALVLDTLTGFASLNGLVIYAIGCVDTATAGVHQGMIAIRAAGSNNNNRAYLGVFGTSLRYAFRRLDSDGPLAMNNGPVTSGEPFILLASVNYLAGTVEIFKNGVLQARASLASSGTSQNSAPGSISIGAEVLANGSLASQLTGHIFGVGIMPITGTPKSADDLVALHHYLRIAKGIG